MNETKNCESQAVHLTWEGRRSTSNQTPTLRKWVIMKVNWHKEQWRVRSDPPLMKDGLTIPGNDRPASGFTGGQYGIEVGAHPLCSTNLDTKGAKA